MDYDMLFANMLGDMAKTKRLSDDELTYDKPEVKHCWNCDKANVGEYCNRCGELQTY